MKTRIVILPNGKYVLEVKRFLRRWIGVDRCGTFISRRIFWGLERNPTWSFCWCYTKEEAEKRKLNIPCY